MSSSDESSPDRDKYSYRKRPAEFNVLDVAKKEIDAVNKFRRENPDWKNYRRLKGTRKISHYDGRSTFNSVLASVRPTSIFVSGLNADIEKEDLKTAFNKGRFRSGGGFRSGGSTRWGSDGGNYRGSGFYCSRSSNGRRSQRRGGERGRFRSGGGFRSGGSTRWENDGGNYRGSGFYCSRSSNGRPTSSW